MKWKDEYRVGIGDIDDQHRVILQCIASIGQAAARHDRPSAEATLVRLAELAQAHFKVEESLMRMHDFPHLDEHVDDHRRFSVHLKTLQERFLTPDVFHDGIHSMCEWWNAHIQKHDKPYALHFLKRMALGRS